MDILLIEPAGKLLNSRVAARSCGRGPRAFRGIHRSRGDLSVGLRDDSLGNQPRFVGLKLAAADIETIVDPQHCRKTGRRTSDSAPERASADAEANSGRISEWNKCFGV